MLGPSTSTEQHEFACDGLLKIGYVMVVESESLDGILLDGDDGSVLDADGNFWGSQWVAAANCSRSAGLGTA